MSALEVAAIAVAAVALAGFAVAVWAACAHAAYLIHQERRSKGIELELEPTTTRGRLGIQTKTRPRRSHDRPHEH